MKILLSLDKYFCRIFKPQIIKCFKDHSKIIINDSNYNNIKIKDIQCGKTFSLFINTTNNIYACGINDLNQLGFKELEPKDNLYNPEIQCDDYIYPTFLKCFNDKKVESYKAEICEDDDYNP